MTYGVRFCGGCNPRYDRKAALERLQAQLEGRIEFVNAVEGAVYDGLLVLGGCPNCCADYSRFQFKQPEIVMWDAAQEAGTRKALEGQSQS